MSPFPDAKEKVKHKLKLATQDSNINILPYIFVWALSQSVAFRIQI